MKQTFEIEVPEGKRAEWINNVLTLVDEPKADNRPVTERIKTFDDALKELCGMAKSGDETASVLLSDYESNANNIISLQTVAYMKLCIVCAALNEGWEPQFTENEKRWYPWFDLLTEETLKNKIDKLKTEHNLWLVGGSSNYGAYCGLAYSNSIFAWSFSHPNISARLAVKSEELAVYFGNQFIDIWADYVFLNNHCHE